MIQTTKDADKAKTSQRQRVDDQNDRFVSRNCHRAPHQSHVFWALLIHFFSAFRICCVTHSPGPQKNELRSAHGGYFIPHTFDKINRALFLWLMIRVLGHRSEGPDTGSGSFGRFARRRPTRPSFKLPGECGGISRIDHKKNCPKDTSPKDTSPKDTRPSDCCCRA
jgi:hypothetical protein